MSSPVLFVVYCALALLAVSADGVAASTQVAEVVLTARGSEIHGTANVDQDTLRGEIVGNGADFTLAGRIINGRLSFQLTGRVVPACMVARQQASGESEIVQGTASASVSIDCGFAWAGGDWPVTVSITFPAVSDSAASPASTSGAPTPPAAAKSADSLVTSVQSSLVALGFDPGQVNGNLTPTTAQAIRQYEQSIGLPEDGQITPQLLASLQTALALRQRAPAETSPSPKISATGTGFYVSNAGVLITNFHVVENCSRVAVPEGDATLLAVDAENDLALLRAPFRGGEIARLRDKPSVRAGEEIVVLAFPSWEFSLLRRM